MYSKTTLIGRVGADAKAFEREAGLFVTFQVATTGREKVNGEFVDVTSWHNVTVFGKSAEYVKNNFKKGVLVFVDGRLKYTQKVNENGQARDFCSITATEVKLLQSKERAQQVANAESESKQIEISNVNDDDIPF